MAGMTHKPKKHLMLFSGRSHPALADAVAAELQISLTPTTAYDFANGEIFIRFQESVRGADAFVLQAHTAPINKWIMEQMIMVDALKRASAKRITVVVPFYGYARQDKKHRGREPISARLLADLFKTAGADRLISVDPGDLADWAAQKGIPADQDHPEVKKAIDAHVAKVNEDLASFESINSWTLVEPLSVDNGLLTASLKVKRNIVTEKYSGEIEDMYSGKKK